MSWLFSRALVAASSADTCSDGEQSAQLSTTPTPQAYLWRDKTTAAWRRFPSGMTCEHLTESRGEELLMSYLAGFRAKTFPPQDAAKESTENEADCGVKWHALCRKFDHVSSSWKTHRCLFSEDLPLYSLTLPKWGLMRDGELFRRKMPNLFTREIGYGFVPTPRVQMHRTPPKNRIGKNSDDYHGNLEEFLGAPPSVDYVLWMMGWPSDWTSLKPLATDKFQLWRRSHGDY